MPQAQQISAQKSDQVIINLGTNDVLQELTVDTSMASLQQMVDLFKGSKCIHLVNINEHMLSFTTGKSVADGAERFNAGLQDLAKADGRISIVDWAGASGDSLDTKNPPTSSLTFDSVHPTTQGDIELNKLYANALDGCGGPIRL